MQNPIFKHLRVLNKKEVKRLLERVEEQYAVNDLMGVFKAYVFLRNRKDKVFIVNREIADVDLNRLRINSFGLYFCKVDKNGIRLSIEGAQIIGGMAQNNVVEVNNADAGKWLMGRDLSVLDSRDKGGFVILKNSLDFLGCGVLKNGIVLNYVPKERRLKEVLD